MPANTTLHLHLLTELRYFNSFQSFWKTISGHCLLCCIWC